MGRWYTHFGIVEGEATHRLRKEIGRISCRLDYDSSDIDREISRSTRHHALKLPALAERQSQSSARWARPLHNLLWRYLARSPRGVYKRDFESKKPIPAIVVLEDTGVIHHTLEKLEPGGAAGEAITCAAEFRKLAFVRQFATDT